MAADLSALLGEVRLRLVRERVARERECGMSGHTSWRDLRSQVQVLRGLDETRRLLYVLLFGSYDRAEALGTVANALIHHHPDVLEAAGFTAESLLALLWKPAYLESPEGQDLLRLVGSLSAALVEQDAGEKPPA